MVYSTKEIGKGIILLKKLQKEDKAIWLIDDLCN